MYVDIFGDIRESKTKDRSFLKKKKKGKRKRNTKKGRNKFETQRRRICFDATLKGQNGESRNAVTN